MHLSEAPQQPRPGSKRQALGSFMRRAWRSLRQHPLMKLLALLMAIVFWAALIASDPTILREKVISDAEVTIIGLDTLRGRGYTVSEDLSGKQITVRMRAEVAQRDYERVTATSFAPRLDLSRVKNVTGEQQLYFTQGLTTYGEVVEFDPAYITVNIEPYITKSRVPVVVEQEGQSEESLWVRKPTVEPEYVSISGPDSLVKQVANAAVVLPLEALDSERENDSISATITLRDRNLEPINSSLIRITSESIAISAAVINVTVYPMIELPVDVSTALRGTPAHGYAVGEVHLSPESVLVAGPQAVLDRLKSLYVETPVDVSGASESILGGSELRVSQEIEYASASEVVIQVNIDPATHAHTYTGLTVEIRNLDPSLRSKLSQSVQSVVIHGDYAQVEALKAGQIHLYVDARGLAAGDHRVPVLCEIDGMEDFLFTPQNEQLLLTLSGG
ncbi:MAG TPA: CdaR family protein [Clostridia bacterium]|nr:CdaR family protein [Clostridia bacterium]